MIYIISNISSQVKAFPYYLVFNFYQINRMVRFELVTAWSLKL